MYQDFHAVLFRSGTRLGLLDLLFGQGRSGTMSELARYLGVTPRSVAVEVRNLAGVGLVSVEGIGGADLVRANHLHPAVPHIRGLLRIDAGPSQAGSLEPLRESLAAYGAPFASARREAHMPLEDAVLSALEAARTDGTVLRVLPIVLSKNLEQLQWGALKEGASRRKLKAELGFLIELTAELLGRPALRRQAAALRDRRRRVPRYFPEARSEFERRLARARSPAVARRWGFYMNSSMESFRSSLERHFAG